MFHIKVLHMQYMPEFGKIYRFMYFFHFSLDNQVADVYYYPDNVDNLWTT